MTFNTYVDKTQFLTQICVYFENFWNINDNKFLNVASQREHDFQLVSQWRQPLDVRPITELTLYRMFRKLRTIEFSLQTNKTITSTNSSLAPQENKSTAQQLRRAKAHLCVIACTLGFKITRNSVKRLNLDLPRIRM